MNFSSKLYSVSSMEHHLKSEMSFLDTKPSLIFKSGMKWLFYPNKRCAYWSKLEEIDMKVSTWTEISKKHKHNLILRIFFTTRVTLTYDLHHNDDLCSFSLRFMCSYFVNVRQLNIFQIFFFEFKWHSPFGYHFSHRGGKKN